MIESGVIEKMTKQGQWYNLCNEKRTRHLTKLADQFTEIILTNIEKGREGLSILYDCER
jgi:hypothetical protein